MLHLSLRDENWGRDTEQLVARMNKKLEKEFGGVSDARIDFVVSQKSRNKSIVQMSLTHRGETIYEQEYAARSWQNTLDLCIQHAIWLLRQSLVPLEPKPTRSNRFSTY
ncbi:MAG: hypothetical protein H3C47_07120 [Candidatus Cloacimonetes bacterium]|nr:hypothetical protein [Candidatus Cloacimonadota bacterium]